MYIFISSVILLLGISMPVEAQYMTKQISNIDGLSNSSVNCVFEDSEHVLWIGTWDGVNLYNGREIKTYRYSKNNPHSISNNIIRQIVEQNTIYVWIATDAGLSRWDRNKQLFDRFFENKAGFFTAITPTQRVICSIYGEGLFYFDEKQSQFAAIKSKLDKRVREIYIDSSNNMYMLIEGGVLKRYRIVYDNETILLDEKSETTLASNVSSIYLYGDRLAVNYNEYVELIDTQESSKTIIEIPQGKSIAKTVHNGKAMLILYNEGGCAKYSIEQDKFIAIDNISKEVPVFSIGTGSQDIFWVGTDGQGVIALYEYTSPFRTVRIDHTVRSFCEDDRGNILVGTKGEGIKLLNKETGQITGSIRINNGFNANSVYVIRKNKSGDIFIGTDGHGLSIIRRNSEQVEQLIIPAHFPLFSSVYCLLFGQNDSQLWLGTAGYGLIKLSLRKESGKYIVDDMKQYMSSDKKTSLSKNTVYSIVEGKDDNELWVGTRAGGGVNRFNIEKETFERLEDIDPTLSLSNNDIISMQKGRTNRLWIGTSYGLNQLQLSSNPPRTVSYDENEDFVNNTIHGVLEDKNENVWVSTNRGLFFLDTKSGKVINYTSRNGLQSDEFSDGAYYIDSQNTLFFGGVGGVSYFNADEIHLRNYEPDIKLANLKVNNINQNIYDRIKNNSLRLSYDEPYTTFTFVVNDFINNENCELNYRILGFADDWIDNQNSANIVITKLPPGKYVLEVKGTNGDRVWSNKTYALHLDIGYPWWRSNIAYLIYLVIVASIAYFVTSTIRNRIRMSRQILLDRIEKQHQEKIHESKLNFFTNIAHEFFTPLTLIYGPAQHLLEKAGLDSYSKRYIHIIKNNADRMQKLINELMEFRKAESGHTSIHPERIDIRQLIEYVSDNYLEIAAENKIDFSVGTKDLSTFATDRNAIEKITFNLVSNAFKYTPIGGYINIEVWQEKTEDGLLHFSIKNSGKGLTNKQMSEIFSRFKIFEKSKPQNATSTGIGLNLTKSLVELLGGRITVTSVLGEYVEFVVAINPMQMKDEGNNEKGELIAGMRSELISKKKDISILIVEDEKNIRELLRDILLPYYNVREAGDGKEGLAEVEQNMPDIIISDILMPDLDGIGLIDCLKSDEKTAHIPIISISAKNTIEDQINAYEHGADLYITKPFHPRHVLTTVENIVNKHTMLKKYFNSSRSAITVKDGITLHHEDEELLREIILFIENNIDDDSLNPSSISDFIGISKASLYDKLKKLANKTPSEYIRVVRLEHASKLLKTTQLTVSEIMYKSGFSSKSYFYKEFAKFFGSSPMEYRKGENE